MTLEARKIIAVQELLGIEDEKLFERVEQFLQLMRVEKYRNTLKPMTKNDLVQRARAAEEAIAKGECMDVEDVINEMENW